MRKKCCCDKKGACCLLDETCKILTQKECEEQCGVYHGDDVPCLECEDDDDCNGGLCSNNECTNGIDCAFDRGACCYCDPPVADCEDNLTYEECAQGEVSRTCVDGEVVIEYGNPIGTYQGTDTVCEDIDCDCNFGACCFNSGDCDSGEHSCEDNYFSYDCHQAGGQYLGHDSTCDGFDDDPCAPDTGACVLDEYDDSYCQTCIGEVDCTYCSEQDGDWYGGESCEDLLKDGTIDCERGICCLPPGSCEPPSCVNPPGTCCQNTTFSYCDDLGGSWEQGTGPDQENNCQETCGEGKFWISCCIRYCVNPFPGQDPPDIGCDDQGVVERETICVHFEVDIGNPMCTPTSMDGPCSQLRQEIESKQDLLDIKMCCQWCVGGGDEDSRNEWCKACMLPAGHPFPDGCALFNPRCCPDCEPESSCCIFNTDTCEVNCEMLTFQECCDHPYAVGGGVWWGCKYILDIPPGGCEQGAPCGGCDCHPEECTTCEEVEAAYCNAESLIRGACCVYDGKGNQVPNNCYGNVIESDCQHPNPEYSVEWIPCGDCDDCAGTIVPL